MSGDTPSPSSVSPGRPEFSESAFAVMLGQYAVMQTVVAATGLVRNKVIALRLGPAPFGEFAQMATVVGAVVAVVSFGMQVSLSRNVARANSFAERQAYLANANGLVLSLSLVATAALLALLVAGDLLPIVGLPVNHDTIVAAGLCFATIPLLGLQTNYLSMLQGLLDVRGLAVQRSIAVLVATAICIPLVWVLGLVGAAANFLVLNALLAALLGLRCHSLGYNWLAIRLQRNVIIVLAGFGLASMAASFAQTFADTAIRASLLKQYGSDANGLVQAPLVLAGTLQAVVLGSVGSVSLATISGTSSIDDTRQTIDRLLNVALPLSTVALALLGLLGVPAIIALYSEQFVDSASLLPWILCAGLLQAATWVVGAPLLASGDRLIWLVLELVWAGARWVISIALLPVYGPAAVGMGMLFAITLHLILNLAAIRVRYQLRVAWRHGVRLIAGLALVGLLAVIGAYSTTSALAMGVGTAVWLGYAAWVARSTPVMSRVSIAWSRLRSSTPRR